MLDKRIKFDEKWEREDGSVILWFTAPKDLLPKEYPEAECMELSLEFPTCNLVAEDATTEYSPTMYDEKEESYVDYDWNEIEEFM